MAGGRPKTKAAIAFGARVREYRQAHGWSQEVLAERADYHFTYIGQIERGGRNVTLMTILRVAKALGLDASELVTSLQL